MKLIPEVSTFVEKNKKRNENPKSSMHSFELVLTVIIFFLLGRLLDSQLDTTPLFTLIFGVVGVAGSFASAYYRYMLTSKKEDAGKAWSRETVKTPVEIEKDEDRGLEIPKGYGANDEY